MEGDEETARIKDSSHFRINALEQGIQIESRAQSAADIVKDVQLFAAARSLLDQIAVFDRHADLLAECQQQSPLRRGEIAVIGGTEQQHAEDALFRLKADADDRAQALCEQQLAHLAEGFFLLERFPVRIASEVAKHHKAAQPCNKIDEVFVETVLLHRRAEGIAHPRHDHRRRTVASPCCKQSAPAGMRTTFRTRSSACPAWFEFRRRQNRTWPDSNSRARACCVLRAAAPLRKRPSPSARR